MVLFTFLQLMRCLLGPPCQTVEKLKELISNGMNIARLNFSHGSYEVSCVYSTLRVIKQYIEDVTVYLYQFKKRKMMK